MRFDLTDLQLVVGVDDPGTLTAGADAACRTLAAASERLRGAAGRVRLRGNSAACREPLPAALAGFPPDHPHTDVTLAEARSEDVAPLEMPAAGPKCERWGLLIGQCSTPRQGDDMSCRPDVCESIESIHA